MTQHALKMEPHPETPETGISGDQAVASALMGALGDSLVLLYKTQGYHWNVIGPLFQPIHELTERQYAALFAAVDKLAERIRALGHIAPFSMADMISHAQLSEEDTARNAQGMVEQLASDNETLVRRLLETAAIAAEHGDGATEDLMNARMADHEEAIWMLRAIAST
ncbi:MAG: DNA starvation/stationary phase protection protein [Sulfitobacter sp.]